MANPIRVLAVGDDSTALAAVVEQLDREDGRIAIDATKSAATARELLAESVYDCIVADYKLADETGISLLESVRETHPDIPYILATAQGDEALASEAIAANVSAYLPLEDVSEPPESSNTSELSNTQEPPQSHEVLESLSKQIRSLVTRTWDEGAKNQEADVYEVIAEMATDVFWTIDVPEETVWFSDGLHTFGYDRETIPVESDWFQERIHPNDQAVIAAHLGALLERDPSAFDNLTANRGSFSNEFRFQHADGSYVDCHIWGVLQFDAAGEPQKLIGALTDISDRKADQRALERAHSRIELALEATNATIWEWDVADDSVQTYPAPHHVLGRSVKTSDDFLEAIHEDDRARVRDALETAVENTTSYEVEFRLQHGDGEQWVKDYGESRRAEDGSQYMVGVATDITERKARERELEQSRERLSVALEVADAGVWEWDPVTNEVVWHESTEQLFGLEPGTFQRSYEAFTKFVPPEELPIMEEAIEEALPNRDPFEAEFRVRRANGELFWLHARAEFLDIEGLSPRYIGVVSDITELKQYEQTLTNLHQATRQVVRSDSPSEVSRRIVNAAKLVLDASSCTMLLYDDAEVALIPEIVTGSHSESIGETRIAPDDNNQLWQAFVDGETTIMGPDLDAQAPDFDGETDGAREAPTPGTTSPWEEISDFGTGGDESSSSGASTGVDGLFPDRTVLLPLGDHGLFVISEDEVAFDERTVNLAEMVAANAEAALDRISREQDLEARDEQLRERAERLAQLDEVNERVREIIHKLIRAKNRQEIEEIVCSELVAAERFQLSGIVEYDSYSEAVSVRTAAGESQEYFDAVSLSGPESQEPALRAAREGEVITVEGIGRDFREEPWRQEALKRGFQSVLAIPIAHDDIPYGNLVVYANSDDTFDEETQDVLFELATAIAHVLRSVVQREALLSDQQVELQFSLTDPHTTLFTLSERLEVQLVVNRILSQTDTQLAYGRVSGVDAETFLEVTDAMTGIDRARVLSETSDQLRVEIRITGETLATTTAEHGGVFQELVAANGQGSITVVFPSSAQINEFIEMFMERYPESDLAARRDREPPEEPPVEGIHAGITERQTEVLQAAYHSGFFEWPRDSTGEEVAESLDISPSAFRENLRRAERNLLEWFISTTRQQTTLSNQ